MVIIVEGSRPDPSHALSLGKGKEHRFRESLTTEGRSGAQWSGPVGCPANAESGAIEQRAKDAHRGLFRGCRRPGPFSSALLFPHTRPRSLGLSLIPDSGDPGFQLPHLLSFDSTSQPSLWRQNTIFKRLTRSGLFSPETSFQNVLRAPQAAPGLRLAG